MCVLLEIVKFLCQLSRVWEWNFLIKIGFYLLHITLYLIVIIHIRLYGVNFFFSILLFKGLL